MSESSDDETEAQKKNMSADAIRYQYAVERRQKIDLDLYQLDKLLASMHLLAYSVQCLIDVHDRSGNEDPYTGLIIADAKQAIDDVTAGILDISKNIRESL